jgi:hypothetical protein
MRAVLAGFTLGLFAAFVPSCGAPACNAMTCAMGCCDAMGRCQAGTMANACGKGGASCSACAPGQACTLQICGGPMAAGGGAAGGFPSAGGSAGGMAMDAGCPVVDDVVVNEPLSAEFLVGDPDGGLAGFEWWTTGVSYEESSRFDEFTAELYFETADGPPAFPYAGTLASGVTNGNCTECFYASLDCDDQGDDCRGGNYLARAGAYDFARGTRNVDAGTFQAGGTNLVFEEWNFGADRAVQGGRCFTVRRLSIGGTWPEARADAGPTDGGRTDAGVRGDGGP